MNNKKTSNTGLNPDTVAELFRKRAADLAGRKTLTSKQDHGKPVLVFGLGDERYALGLEDLSGVFPFHNYTPVPKSDNMICGVINIRGELRCVVELSALLGLDLPQGDETGYVLILKGTELGVRVHRIDQILYVREKDATNIKKKEHSVLAGYGNAVFQGNVVLLNSTKLMSHPILTKKGDFQS